MGIASTYLYFGKVCDINDISDFESRVFLYFVLIYRHFVDIFF
jgi:hypothetical protein